MGHNGRNSPGAASFAMLSTYEKEKKAEEMNNYVNSLQKEFSQSALALSSTLMKNEHKLLSKKDDNMPKKRAPHAYMYNRALDAADSVSLAYPNHDRDGGSSIYYASLSSSVHKMNGTRKRCHMVRDELSSI